MPVYEFMCRDCGKRFDVVERAYSQVYAVTSKKS
jgi:putative FmdB family regulatory protein